LTLCAEDNLRVAYPSTPASLFHLLRWQGRDHVERPLVVMTPKSLLRHPRCVSSLPELAEGRFQSVIDDAVVDPAAVRRLVLLSGKLYYDLLKHRDDQGRRDVALVRLEQLYPFPAAELSIILARYPQAELVWAQEEPRNMGAWRFVRERFADGEVPDSARRMPRYVGRPYEAAPAPGTLKVHLREQEAILRTVLAG
jgi:2-oxoglutarate dehydrogenase E1 component